MFSTKTWPWQLITLQQQQGVSSEWTAAVTEQELVTGDHEGVNVDPGAGEDGGRGGARPARGQAPAAAR